MNWSDIGKLVGDTAPALGALLAPVTGGASLAIGGMIGSLLGTSNEPKAIAEKITQDPTIILKLKELDAQIAKMDSDERQALVAYDLNNTNSARDMNTRIQETANSSVLSKNASYYLDFAIVGATIVFGLGLFFMPIPVENKEIAYMLFGSMITLSGTIINFHRGSTQGSKDKTNHMANMFKR